MRHSARSLVGKCLACDLQELRLQLEDNLGETLIKGLDSTQSLVFLYQENAYRLELLDLNFKEFQLVAFRLRTHLARLQCQLRADGPDPERV